VKKVKIRIKEACGRQFLSMGKIFLKRNEEKEYDDCEELQMAISKGYVEVIDAEAPKTRGRKKKTE
jgi:hypothetical protein